MSNLNNENSSDTNFFFWLGADGEAEPVSPEEFDRRLEMERENQKAWENAVAGTEPVGRGDNEDGKGDGGTTF